MKKLLWILPALLLAACANHHKGDTYTQSEMGKPIAVSKGVILAKREVVIKGNQGVGTLAGAGAGAAGGSAIGGSKEANIAGAIGGAVIGGLIGATAEKGITEGKAHEFIVKPSKGEAMAIVQKDTEALKVGEHVLIIQSKKVRITRDTERSN